MKDITPTIRFDLRASQEELIAYVDEQQDVRIWRDVALVALAKLHEAGQEIERLRTARRRVPETPRPTFTPEYVEALRLWLLSQTPSRRPAA